MLQKEFFGSESFENIKQIFKAHSVKKILLVSGKNSFIESGASEALSPFLENVEVIRFYDFEPNPRLEDAYSGIKLVRELNPDMIIAIGGGSVIDMGKLIGILVAQTNYNEIQLILNNSLIQNKGLPLIAIPTTSGTGSEATHFSVVYIDSKKYSLGSVYMMPDYAILAPNLTKNIPKKLAATSGFDALSQAIESFWAVSSTQESRNLAKKAIKTIFPVLVESVCQPSEKSRKDMMLGAHLAGQAINLSKTTAPHAISYTLTSYFGIPHGHAVGLSLGKILELNSKSSDLSLNDSRGNKFVVNRIQELVNLLGGGTPEECGQRLYEIMGQIGLEQNLQELGLKTRENIQLIVQNINVERMANNPVKLTSEDIEAIW